MHGLRGRSAARSAMLCLSLAACAGETLPRGDSAAPGATRAPADSAPDSIADMAAGRITVHKVNRATQGMAVTIRWVLSPDRRILLIVDDPLAVEADAVPNGFLIANEETGRVAQVDSVWHVAPSPNWRQIAFGRAYVLNARERDSLSTAEWAAMARRLDLTPDEVRRNAFLSSGMAIAYGVAQPGVMDAGGAPESRRLLRTVAGGWRVGWTRDRRFAAGGSPARVQDDAPATRWVTIDTVTSVPGAPVDSSEIVPVAWVEGPALDYSIPVDTARVELRAGTVVIVGERGEIRVRSEGGADRVVGPGVPLVTTRRGRFVAALAPRPNPRDYESKWHLVVYDLFDRSTP